MTAMPAIGDVDAAAAIGRDGGMTRFATTAFAAVGLIWLCGTADDGLAASLDGVTTPRLAASEFSSQRRRLRRAPVRITVYPRGVVRSGSRIDLYPRPYPYEWPGPFA